MLSTNAYHDNRSGLLKEVQYGNGGKVQYDYDGYDRLTGVRYDGETTARYAYEYGADGNASMVKDNHLGRVYHTQHDLADRLMDTQLRNADGSLIYRTGLEYDTQNRLTALKEILPIRPFSTGYTYDNDNRVTGMTFDGENALSYTYDNLGRIATRTTGPLSSTYSYVGGGYGAGSTTPLVSSIQQTGVSFSYTYDNRGNIVSETRNGATTTYAYDALGQLIRVNDPHENATWVYNYDRGGNITRTIQYTYTTGEPSEVLTDRTYAYDTVWKDKLITRGDRGLAYDAIGNLTQYSGWTYEWEAGRRLKRQTQENTVVTYEYDHSGMRVRKTVSGTDGTVRTVYDYAYCGEKLAHMTWGSNWMHFFYDAQGRPAKVRYNGTIYSYIHNLQGDVVGIIDTDGNVVVEYKYDAWGFLLSRTGSMAADLGKQNPFRYRGYIYDEETWMYWLKSRYYYPELQRFISTDAFISGDMTVKRANLYEYCFGNPVSYVDYEGCEGEKMHEVIFSTYIYEGDSRNITDPRIKVLSMFGHSEIMIEYEGKWVVASYGPKSGEDTGAAVIEGALAGIYDGNITITITEEDGRRDYWKKLGFTQYNSKCEVNDAEYEFLINVLYCATDHTSVANKDILVGKDFSKTVPQILNCNHEHMDPIKGTYGYAQLKTHAKYKLLSSTCYTAALMLVAQRKILYKYMTPKAKWMAR